MQERREFQVADAKWRLIMAGVVRNPDIMSTTDQEGLLADLQASAATTDRPDCKSVT